jgi:hypothetical protein
MADYKGERIMLTIDPPIYKLLEQWAKRNHIKVASFTTAILTREVLAAESRGECGEISSPTDASPYIAYTRAIAGVGTIDPFELQKLADSLGVDSAMLAAKINGKKKNADKH